MLITGTSTGIGRACALHLAEKGFSVWAGIRTVEQKNALDSAAEQRQVSIRPVHLDVTENMSIKEAEREIKSAVGEAGLVGVINNAGICVVGPVEFITPQAWREQLEVNFIGVISVTQIMLPLLRVANSRPANRGSRIVNMGSITGEISTPLFGAYSASKFALRAMNDALRLELRAEGMHVCLIVPGTIQSEIWRKEKACVDAIAANQPARKIYGKTIDNVAKYVFSCAENALPALDVAQAVLRCMVEKKPRMEYRVGWEAHVGSKAKKWIPGRIFDFLLGKKLGIPSRCEPGRQST